MGKILLYIAQSLDGFIADENGGVDWLTQYLKPDEDYGYAQFYQSLGAVLMGSKTYLDNVGFNYWYHDKEGYVFSSREQPVPEGWQPIFVREAPESLVARLREKEKDSWLVGGAKMVTSFINAGLVDELILSIIPEILTAGIPLFQQIRAAQNLQLLSTQNYKYGVVQLRYAFGPHTG